MVLGLLETKGRNRTIGVGCVGAQFLECVHGHDCRSAHVERLWLSSTAWPACGIFAVSSQRISAIEADGSAVADFSGLMSVANEASWLSKAGVWARSLERGRGGRPWADTRQ